MNKSNQIKTISEGIETNCALLQSDQNPPSTLVEKIAKEVNKLSKIIQETPSHDLSLEEMKDLTEIIQKTTKKEEEIQTLFQNLIAEKTTKDIQTQSQNPTAQKPNPVRPSTAILTKDPEEMTHFKGKLTWKGVKYLVEQDLPQATSQQEWDAMVAAYEQILNDSMPSDNPNCQAGVDRLELSFNAEKEEMNILFPAQSKEKEPISLSLPVKQEIAATLKKGRLALVSSIQEIENKIASIPNRGNTCFIASTMQAWLVYQQEGLKRKLEKATDYEKTVIASILDCIQEYKKSNSFNIRKFLENVMIHYNVPGGDQRLNQFAKQMIEWKKSPSATSYPTLPQADAEELIRWLSQFVEPEQITRLHEEKLVLLPGESVVQSDAVEPDLYEGRRDLLPLKGKTLAHLLDLSFRDDLKATIAVDRRIRNKDGEEKDERVPLEARTERLSKAPQELLLSFKRFRKDNVRIGDAISQVEEILEMPGEKYFADGKSAKYRLRSIICHRGGSTANSGHYVAYVRKFDAQGNSQFYLADDGTITPQETKDVLKAAETAYQLIYDKINEPLS